MCARARATKSSFHAVGSGNPIKNFRQRNFYPKGKAVNRGRTACLAKGFFSKLVPQDSRMRAYERAQASRVFTRRARFFAPTDARAVICTRVVRELWPTCLRCW